MQWHLTEDFSLKGRYLILSRFQEGRDYYKEGAIEPRLGKNQYNFHRRCRETGVESKEISRRD